MEQFLMIIIQIFSKQKIKYFKKCWNKKDNINIMIIYNNIYNNK